MSSSETDLINVPWANCGTIAKMPSPPVLRRIATDNSDNAPLKAALIGYQAEYEKILTAIADIKKKLGRHSTAGMAAPVTRNRKAATHTISPEGIRRIREVQKKRWAAFKKQKKEAAATP